MNINIKIVFIALTTIMLSSCNNWLDISPSDRVTEEEVFTTEKGFHSALNGIYIQLMTPSLYGATLGCEYVEIMAQRFNLRATDVDYKKLQSYDYTTDYSKKRLQATWEAAYQVILNCNKIIENADVHREVLKGNNYSLVVGEAYALRALMHFDILRLFGPIYVADQNAKSIPYSDKISVSAGPLLPADTVIQNRIIRDLSIAENYLKESDPIIANGPMATSEDDNTFRFRNLRMNYYAVLALKARVWLYGENKTEALKYAKMVIEDPNRETYFPFTGRISDGDKNPDRVFSTEVLFSLFNSSRGSIFNNYFNPDNAGKYLLVPKDGMIKELFQGEEKDYRYYPLWRSTVISGENDPNANLTMVCTRYKNVEDTLFYNNLMPMIRLSELYLIAAECDETNNYTYLNTLRNNRNLTNVSDKIATRLTAEYTKEFICEGQLFFYYKRKNINKLKSGSDGNFINMSATTYVAPFPDSENKYRD
ncbi:MAG: RagB/SusD family nutrient uptake outer membrane protein [Odoribacter sp.]